MPNFRRAEVTFDPRHPANQTGPYPGERERHRSRQTGVTVILLDTQIDQTWLSDDGGRWATLCEDHGYYDNYESLAQARQWYAYPAEWCPDCDAIVKAGGAHVPPR